MGINTNDCDELGILYDEATLSGRPHSRFTGYLYAKRLFIRQRILSPSDAEEVEETRGEDGNYQADTEGDSELPQALESEIVGRSFG